MRVETDFRGVLGKQDCISTLQLIHHCTRAQGTSGDVDSVFHQLGQLIPIEAAIIATGRHSRKHVDGIDQLHSHGSNAWLSLYRESGMEQVDPIIQRALDDDAPFRWSDANVTHATRHRGYQTLKRDAGRGDGVAAAFRSRRHAGQLSLMSIAIAEPCIASRHLFIVGQVLPHVHEMLVHAQAPATGAQTRLTGRELEVLRWVAAGKSNWEIGAILALSERTVKFHLSNVFAKLGAFNRAQALAKAVRLGLVSL